MSTITMANAADQGAWKKMLQDYDAKMKSKEVSPLSVVDSAYLKKGEVQYFGAARKWLREKPTNGNWISAAYDGKKIIIQDQSAKSISEDLIPTKKMQWPGQKEWITGQVISPEEARIKIHDPVHPSLKKFKKLEFYPYSPEWSVQAELTLEKPYKKFTFTTVRDRTQDFWRVGTLSFQAQGHPIQLAAYVGEDELKNVKELFIPFRDLTNGKETYGGGRYAEAVFAQPQNFDSVQGSLKVEVDFNHAYQPFCAFSTFYNCVRVPGKPLPVAMKAGEKNGSHNLHH